MKTISHDDVKNFSDVKNISADQFKKENRQTSLWIVFSEAERGQVYVRAALFEKGT